MQDEKQETSAAADAPMEAIRRRAEQSLLDYLEELSGELPIRVTVVRESPKTWKGRRIDGSLETFDEPISEEGIRELYGGGKYRLRIKTLNESGSFVYAAHRTLNLAGDPKLSPKGAEESAGMDAVRESMRLSERLVERAEERAERAEARAAQTPALDPIVGQMIDSLRDELREIKRGRDQRIDELIAGRNQRGPTDVLLEKMLDGDSARLTAVRTQHESEIRAMRERFEAESERQHGRSKDQLDRLEAQHLRETSTIRTTYEGRIEAQSSAHAAALDGARREAAQLERELAAVKAETAELRAKKDKSLIDSVSELAAVREALGAFGGDGDSSSLDRVLTAVLSSPALGRISDRLLTQAPPKPNALAVPPIDPPPVQASRPARASQKESIASDPSDGFDFMETAFGNGTPPEVVAQTIHGLLGSAELSALATAGPEGIAAQIVAARPESPLIKSQRGKNWLRAVLRLLAKSGQA